MIKQKIAGMIFIACGIISALPERDITAAILIVPLGIYAIFTKKKDIQSERSRSDESSTRQQTG